MGPLAIYLSDFKGGGVQRILITIANSLAERGCDVDLVVCKPEGDFSALRSDRVRLHLLKPANGLSTRLAVLRADFRVGLLSPRIFLGARYRSKTLAYLPALADYLARRRPSALLSATPFQNIEAVLARRLSGVPTRVVVSEHSHIPVVLPKLRRRAELLVPAMRWAYKEADRIVAVSRGVADELAVALGTPRERIEVIYNPIVSSQLLDHMREPVQHPWFLDRKIPVVVAVGRIARQKDFPTLLHAFAKLRENRLIRLAIIGTGNERARARLLNLAEELGVTSDMALLGFQLNPLPYIARANLCWCCLRSGRACRQCSSKRWRAVLRSSVQIAHTVRQRS